MRYLLGSVVLVALLILPACGAEEPTTAGDPPPTDTSPADPPVVIGIVSQSAAGGEVTTTPTLLPTGSDLGDYVAGLGSPELAAKVTALWESHDPGPGRVLGAAVIAIGCDVPPEAHVTEVGGELAVTPGKVTDPHQECLVPVTSVAVLDLPTT